MEDIFQFLNLFTLTLDLLAKAVLLNKFLNLVALKIKSNDCYRLSKVVNRLHLQLIENKKAL